MSIKKRFGLFLLINLIVWSLIPLLRKSLPMDTQEAIVWGKYCILGTTKHPPFSGIIAYGFYLLSGGFDGAMYLLSQLFAALGIFYIYKLARLFVDETKAVLAAMLQFGVIYYDFSSVEFNVNVVSLALWPACAYYFWRACKENRWLHWILFGVLTGINLLNKYVAGLQILSFGIFILADRDARRILKNGRAYVAALCGLAVVCPHVWWLYENNFEMWNYIAFRNTGTKTMASEWRHILYPLKFLGGQLLFAAAACLTYFAFMRKTEKEKLNLTVSAKRFLLISGFLPPLVFAFISLVAGTPLKSMWGFPCLYLTGLTLIVFLPRKFDKAGADKLFAAMAAWSMIFAAAYGLQCLFTTSARFRTDCRQITGMLEEKWREHTGGKDLRYVGSDVWYADMFALYGSHEIKPMIWMSPESNPWFDAVDFTEKGALIVTTNLPEYEKYRKQYRKAVSEPQRLEFITENYFGKIKRQELFYGFYNTGREKENEK